MKYLQLFKEIPPDSLMREVFRCYNLEGMFDNLEFSKKDLEDTHAIDKMILLVPELNKFYVPCKAKTYLKDLTAKKCITILSQLLRLHGYLLHRRERFINRKKTIIYCIKKKGDKEIHIGDHKELTFD